MARGPGIPRRLFGTHAEPEEKAGDAVPLLDGEEILGWVLRTRDRVRPIYVSVGHRADLASARDLVLARGAGVTAPAAFVASS